VVEVHRYIFGEGDGPFNCQAGNCTNDTYSIYHHIDLDNPRELIYLNLGKALCERHKPEKILPRTKSGCMAVLASKQTKEGDIDG
jgi:hypothetical protein